MDKLLSLSGISNYCSNITKLLSACKKLGVNRKYTIRSKTNNLELTFFKLSSVTRIKKMTLITTDIYWYEDGKKHRTTINPKTGLTLPAQISYFIGKYIEAYVPRSTPVNKKDIGLCWKKAWYQNGKLHRDDSNTDPDPDPYPDPYFNVRYEKRPAIIWSDGLSSGYTNDEKTYDRRIKNW